MFVLKRTPEPLNNAATDATDNFTERPSERGHDVLGILDNPGERRPHVTNEMNPYKNRFQRPKLDVSV